MSENKSQPGTDVCVFWQKTVGIPKRLRGVLVSEHKHRLAFGNTRHLLLRWTFAGQSEKGLAYRHYVEGLDPIIDTNTQTTLGDSAKKLLIKDLI